MAKAKKATKRKTTTGPKTKAKKLSKKNLKKLVGGFAYHLPFFIGPQGGRTPNPGTHYTPVSSRSPSPSPSGGGANRQKAGR